MSHGLKFGGNTSLIRVFIWSIYFLCKSNFDAAVCNDLEVDEYNEMGNINPNNV